MKFLREDPPVLAGIVMNTCSMVVLNRLSSSLENDIHLVLDDNVDVVIVVGDDGNVTTFVIC